LPLGHPQPFFLPPSLPAMVPSHSMLPHSPHMPSAHPRPPQSPSFFFTTSMAL
jgi:hypothetical protein